MLLLLVLVICYNCGFDLLWLQLVLFGLLAMFVSVVVYVCVYLFCVA